MTRRNLPFLIAAGLTFITAMAGAASLASILGSAALLIGVATVVMARQAPANSSSDTLDQHQMILDSLPEAVVHYGSSGQVHFANRAACALLGCQPSESKHQTDLLNLIDRQTRAALTPALMAEIGRGMPVSLAPGTCLISSEGVEFDVEGQASPILDATGRVTSAVFTLRDVTETREAQRRHAGTIELDPICALPKESILVERLERNLLSKRAVDNELSYMHIELDGIAQLDAAAGQNIANQLLRQAGQVMLSRVRDSDTLSCVGQHAFGLLLPACPREVSERILRTLEESIGALTFDWQGHTYQLAARIGIVHAPPFTGVYDECQAEAIKAARHLHSRAG
jgi:PAS domain S-box-containing protein